MTKGCIFLPRVIAAVLLLSPGCGTKKKSEQAPEKAPRSLAAVVGLEAIPASATAVLGVDVAALAGSPMVLRAAKLMFSRDPGLQKDLARLLKACKIRIETDISSATIALIPTGREAQSDSLLVVKGRFSEGDIVACFGKSLQEEAGGRLEVSTQDGRSLYHQIEGQGSGLWFAFGSPSTILISSGHQALISALGFGSKLLSAKKGIGLLLPRVDTEANLWAVGQINAEVGAGLVKASGAKVKAPRAVVGSASLHNGLKLEVALQTNGESEAKILISQAKLQIEAAALVLQIDSLGTLVQKVELASDGVWAELRWTLDLKELRQLMGSNLSGLGLSIDKQRGKDENPAPNQKRR